MSRFLDALLYDTQSVNLLTYAAVVVLLALVAALAALVPGLRAARVDPRVTLVSE